MQQQVIGVVENMSWLETVCPHCGKSHRVTLFGEGGGRAAANALSKRLGTEVPLLGQIPLDQQVRVGGDDGDPIVLSHPESPAAQALTELAEGLDSRPRGLAGMHLGVTPVAN